eukprot:7767137-Lingulodinium_polyedra.AAC.1
MGRRGRGRGEGSSWTWGSWSPTGGSAGWWGPSARSGAARGGAGGRPPAPWWQADSDYPRRLSEEWQRAREQQSA